MKNLIILLTIVFSTTGNVYANNPSTQQPIYNLRLVTSTAINHPHQIKMLLIPNIEIAGLILNLKLNVHDKLKQPFDSLLFLTMKGQDDFYTDSTKIYNNSKDYAANSFKFIAPNQDLTVTRLWLNDYQNISTDETQKIHLIYTLVRELGFLIELKDNPHLAQNRTPLAYKDWLNLRTRALQNMIYHLQSNRLQDPKILNSHWRLSLLKIAQDQLPWYLKEYSKTEDFDFLDLPVTQLPQLCRQTLEAANDTHYTQYPNR